MVLILKILTMAVEFIERFLRNEAYWVERKFSDIFHKLEGIKKLDTQIVPLYK